jgi:TPR repeat protein
MIFYNKYLKYKNKYIELKNIQKGGLECDNELVFKNTIGSCWMVAIHTILVFGDFTKNHFEEILQNININKKEINDIKQITNEKKCFIERQIQNVKNNPNFNNILPSYIYNSDKIEYLKNILNSFIDRYYSKIFKIRNNEQPDKSSSEYKDGRCEILINNNFKRLYIDYSINVDKKGGDIIEQYLFINTILIFLLNYKVSFINYYKDNYNEINYNDSNFIGIIVAIEEHACCFFLCDSIPKYYNDNNKKTYDCDWKKLLKETDKDLYIVDKKLNVAVADEDLYVADKDLVIALNKHEFLNYPNYNNLKIINCLTVITKNINYNFDEQINIILNIKEDEFNKISDRTFLYNIGLMYDFGSNGLTKNICKVFDYYKKSAKKGYVQSQYYLGLSYLEKKNIDLAIKWITKAAINELSEAQYKLGTIYEKNNIVEAIYWYTKAAMHGNDLAQYLLAYKYETGTDISQNFCKAIYWYTKIIEKYKDNNTIQYKLGINYYNIGNYKKALKLLKISGEKNVDAQLKLGQIHKDGIDNYKHSDFDEALEWYKKAADIENTEALTNIGLIYEELSNMNPDDEQYEKLAYENYTKAAHLNDKNAQYYLAKMYENGKYVKENKEEAIKWYTESAKNGNADVQYKLGIYYFNEKKNCDGIKWFTILAENGNTDVQYKLGIYYENINDHAEAFKWLEKAAKQNNIDAQFMLANMYNHYRDIDESDCNAIYWYQKASEQGHEDAKKNLQLITKSKNVDNVTQPIKDNLEKKISKKKLSKK